MALSEAPAQNRVVRVNYLLRDSVLRCLQQTHVLTAESAVHKVVIIPILGRCETGNGVSHIKGRVS